MLVLFEIFSTRWREVVHAKLQMMPLTEKSRDPFFRWRATSYLLFDTKTVDNSVAFNSVLLIAVLNDAMRLLSSSRVSTLSVTFFGFLVNSLSDRKSAVGNPA